MIRAYRFTCKRCNGHELVQDAYVDLNTGAIDFADTLWCRTCENDVEVNTDADVPEVMTQQVPM